MKTTSARRRAPAWVVALGCALFGTIVPMLAGLWSGFPEPQIQDEFSYLLGADTFARGRLSNPAPEFPRFFESEHILVTPVYQSKYPPSQALVLAFGQIVLGHPIWGVWISCGIFAGSLAWMLQLWTSRYWALATTVISTVTLGSSSYWAQSYWGGMLTAAGAALFLGAVRSALVAPSALAGVLLGVGILLLASTRPYDGVLVAAPAMLLLAHWAFAARLGPAPRRLIAIAIPLIAVLVLGAAAMARYNQAITGKPLVLPYQVHVKQYLYRGVFIFSSPLLPERAPPDRVRDFYIELAGSPQRGLDLVKGIAFNFAWRLPVSLCAPFVMTSTLIAEEPYRGLVLWLLLLPHVWRRRSRASFAMLAAFATAGELLMWRFMPFYPWPLIPLFLPVLLILLESSKPRGRWWRLSAAIVLIAVLGQSLVQWWLPHYTAATFPAIFAVIASAFSRHSTRLGARAAARLPAVLAILVAAQLAALTISGALLRERRQPTPHAAAQTELLKKPGSHLVFVKYDPRYNRHREWVYNDADLLNTRVLFAHDLGDAENQSLMRSNSARVVWRLAVSPESVRLEPYQ